MIIIVRGCRPGKSVQMTEAEVRGLCLRSREIFLQQPILLELEAPLKICGMYLFVVYVMLDICNLFSRRYTWTIYRLATSI